VLGSDANLAKLFAADGAGDSIQFRARRAVQPERPASRTSIRRASRSSSPPPTRTHHLALRGHHGDADEDGGLNTDVAAINSNSGGANSIEERIRRPRVWDITNTGDIAYWDGGGISNANTTGTTANL